MPEEKEIGLPNSFVKNFFTVLMVAGILLYLTWSVVLIVAKGIFFDIGLYSICIVMILGGLAGRLLYGHKQRVEG
jgi:hypothetical protein